MGNLEMKWRLIVDARARARKAEEEVQSLRDFMKRTGVQGLRDEVASLIDDNFRLIDEKCRLEDDIKTLKRQLQEKQRIILDLSQLDGGKRHG